MAAIEPDAKSLERIRFVTRNYWLLQGLKVVPMGAGFLVVAALHLVRAGQAPDPRLGRVVGLGLLALAVLGYFLGAAYYHRVFGRVRQTRAERIRTLLVILLSCAVAFASMTLLIKLEVGVWAASWLTFSILCVFYWRWTDRWLPQWGWVAALSAVLGVLELWPGAPLDRGLLWLLPSLGERAAAFRYAFVFGTLCIVLGLLDDRVLRRFLGGTAEEMTSEAA